MRTLYALEGFLSLPYVLSYARPVEETPEAYQALAQVLATEISRQSGTPIHAVEAEHDADQAVHTVEAFEQADRPPQAAEAFRYPLLGYVR
jgi:hypothetical protein